VVFLAYDPQLCREVALKVPRPEALATPELRERFGREARAAAALDHPNLVPVYEAGTEGAVFYIASAYCPGKTLAEWLRRRSDPVPFRLAAWLLARLAGGVGHAHSRGVVHRDLKPSNVLLETSGSPPVDDGKRADLGPNFIPRVTDFGLAKIQESTDGTFNAGCATQSGAVVGTPRYMAPEQARGQSHEIGRAADVWALGVILYELLTGRPPFVAETPLEVLEQVRLQEPVPPRRLTPRCPRDLETICLKCLRKEPARRYPSAEALADDLRRFQAGEPIRARPVGAWERAVKWAERRPAVAGLLAAVVLLTAAGLTGVTWQWLRVEEQKQQVEKALGETDQARRAEKEQKEKVEASDYRHRIALAHHEWLAGNVLRAEQLLDECPSALRRWEWHYLKRLCHADLFTWSGAPGSFGNAAFSPDGRYLAGPGRDRTIKVWDTATGQEYLGFPGLAGNFAVCVAFSPDGKRLAAARGSVRVWEVETGKEVFAALAGDGANGNTHAVAFSPDGKRLAAAHSDNSVRLWDAATGQVAGRLQGHTAAVLSVAYSPDCRWLATGSLDRTVKLWDASTGAEIRTLPGHGDAVASVAFSPDGRHLASAGRDRTVKLREAATGNTILTLRGHTAPVSSVAYSPDGLFLASGSADQVVKVWEASTGQEVRTLRGHQGTVLSVAFSPAGLPAFSGQGDNPRAIGQRLASAAADGTVKLWDATTDQEARMVPTLPGSAQLVAPTFSPDGKYLAGPGTADSVQVWDATTGKPVLTLRGHTAAAFSVAYSPDGRRLASGSADGTIKLWEAATGKAIVTLRGHKGAVASLAHSPDGRLLASGSADGTVKLWEASTGREVRTLPGHKEAVLSVVFSPDGRRLVSSSHDRTAKLWDVSTGEDIHTFLGNPLLIFSPDGKYLAAATGAARARVWEAETGQELFALLPGENIHANAVAFSPDSQYLAAACTDMTVRVWHAATGKEISRLQGHTELVSSVAYSPDGRRLASGSYGKTVKVWDVSTSTKGQQAGGQELLTLQAHADFIRRVTFSPDGQRLAAAAGDGTTTLWEAMPLGQAPGRRPPTESRRPRSPQAAETGASRSGT
jgi:WD40 repeat protein